MLGIRILGGSRTGRTVKGLGRDVGFPLLKVPNPKPNSKSQILNPKQIQNPNFKVPNRAIWDLEFGIWSFV
jgi:hypothetical protein